MSVRIVTDATASLTPDLWRGLDITMVPVPIALGADTFLDGVDPAERFYELIAAGRLPKTATPAPGAFLEVYRGLAAAGHDVVSIHVMSTKSGVLQTARLAAGMLPGARIYPVDSGSVSLGLGLQVLGAARLARAGHDAASILAWLQQAVAETAVVAAIRDLTLLRRSGRVSLPKALLAGLLQIKPILELRTGAITVADQARSWPRAVDRVLELAAAAVAASPGDLQLAVVHTDAAGEALALLQRVRGRWPAADILCSDAGPALAAHAGAGALGIAVLTTPAPASAP